MRLKGRKSTRNLHLGSAAQQRWSPRGRPWPRGRPRGQILKSLALASKVRSLALALASRPQVLENWPVLGSRTAVFFGKLKFCGAVEKFFGKRFFVEIAWKIFVKTFFFFGDRLKNFCEDLFFFFFLESTCALCPWSLALASSIPVLGLESVCPRKGCPWPRIFFVSLALALASSLVSSTPPLLLSVHTFASDRRLWHVPCEGAGRIAKNCKLPVAFHQLLTHLLHYVLLHSLLIICC